jgi:hypothetical protein
MLSLRSKIAVTLVVAIGIGVLFSYLESLTSWAAEPRAVDWYIGWIILGMLGAVALVSIIVDLRKDRPIV